MRFILLVVLITMSNSAISNEYIYKLKLSCMTEGGSRITKFSDCLSQKKKQHALVNTGTQTFDISHLDVVKTITTEMHFALTKDFSIDFKIYGTGQVQFSYLDSTSGELIGNIIIDFSEYKNGARLRQDNSNIERSYLALQKRLVQREEQESRARIAKENEEKLAQKEKEKALEIAKAEKKKLEERKLLRRKKRLAKKEEKQRRQREEFLQTKQEADAGSVPSKLLLAEYHLKGIGTEESCKLADEILVSLYKQKNSKAMLMLGDLRQEECLPTQASQVVPFALYFLCHSQETEFQDECLGRMKKLKAEMPAGHIVQAKEIAIKWIGGLYGEEAANKQAQIIDKEKQDAKFAILKDIENGDAINHRGMIYKKIDIGKFTNLTCDFKSTTPRGLWTKLTYSYFPYGNTINVNIVSEMQNTPSVLNRASMYYSSNNGGYYYSDSEKVVSYKSPKGHYAIQIIKTGKKVGAVLNCGKA